MPLVSHHTPPLVVLNSNPSTPLTHTGGTAGTVFELLCHCSSGFGKRLFRKWLCHPLRHIGDIEARFASVDELSSNPELADVLRSLLRKLPDLERDISQIHVGACKVQNFIKTLDAFDKVRRAIPLPA